MGFCLVVNPALVAWSGHKGFLPHADPPTSRAVANFILLWQGGVSYALPLVRFH